MMRAMFFGFVVLAACADDGGGAAAPVAPTGLAVMKLGGGGHLTWMDKSDNEDHFMVMRKDGTGEFAEITTLTFNTTSFHDEPLTAGTMYTYKIVAMNASGHSESNEVAYTHQ